MEFDAKLAKDADKGGGVVESGIYHGVITTMKVAKNDNGATFVEFEFETDDGRTVKYLSMCTHGKNGNPTFQYAKLNALMGLLKIQSASPVDGNLHAFCNKLVAIGLQKTFYENKRGETKFKMEPLHFFSYDTLQTYGELIENKEAKTSKRPIADKVPAEMMQNGTTQNTQAPDDSQLPF